jgi:hypothetical protein
LTQELLGQLGGVALFPATPTADGDDEHDDLASLDAIDDPVVGRASTSLRAVSVHMIAKVRSPVIRRGAWPPHD